MDYERKRKLLFYIKGAYQLACLEDFQSISQFPNSVRNPESVYISETLGVDFDIDVYNNSVSKEVTELLKLDQFIGDEFNSIMLKWVEKTSAFDDELIDTLDDELEELFDKFLKAENIVKGNIELLVKLLDGDLPYSNNTEKAIKILDTLRDGCYIPF